MIKDYELTELFHILWTRAVGTKDYNKKDWQTLVKLLKECGVQI